MPVFPIEPLQVTTILSLIWVFLKTISSLFPQVGTNPFVFGTLEQEKPPKDSLVTPKKSTQFPSLPITEWSSVLVLIAKLSYGTPLPNACSQVKKIITLIGSVVVDTHQYWNRLAKDKTSNRTSQVLDGTDAWKFGAQTSKANTLSRLTKVTWIAWALLPMGDSWPQAEKTRDSKFGTFKISNRIKENTMLDLLLTKLPSILKCNG